MAIIWANFCMIVWPIWERSVCACAHRFMAKFLCCLFLVWLFLFSVLSLHCKHSLYALKTDKIRARTIHCEMNPFLKLLEFRGHVPEIWIRLNRVAIVTQNSHLKFSWFNYKTNNAHFSFDIYVYCEKEMGIASTTEEDREEKIEKKITSIHSQLDERKKKMQQLHKIRSEFCSLRNMVEESCQKWRDKTTNFTFRFKDWLVLLLLPQNPFVFYNRSDHDFLRDFTCPHTINVCSMDEKSVGLKIPRKIVL